MYAMLNLSVLVLGQPSHSTAALLAGGGYWRAPQLFPLLLHAFGVGFVVILFATGGVVFQGKNTTDEQNLPLQYHTTGPSSFFPCGWSYNGLGGEIYDVLRVCY